MNNTDFLILNLLRKNRLGQLFSDKTNLNLFAVEQRFQVSVVLKQFKKIGLEIHLPSLNIHRCLKSTKKFIRDKGLLESCSERTGLVLLPEGIEGLKANAIFYAWRKVNLGHMESKRLYFLPFLDEALSPDLHFDELSALWSGYGTAEFGFYARVHEYLMSLILMNSFAQVYDSVLLDPGFRRLPSLVNSNLVEIIFQAVG